MYNSIFTFALLFVDGAVAVSTLVYCCGKHTGRNSSEIIGVGLESALSCFRLAAAEVQCRPGWTGRLKPLMLIADRVGEGAPGPRWKLIPGVFNWLTTQGCSIGERIAAFNAFSKADRVDSAKHIA